MPANRKMIRGGLGETSNSLESLPTDKEDATEHSAASANSAVAAFYEIEALGKHLLAKFGKKYYVCTVVAANLGKESSTTSNCTHCCLDAPVFAASVTTQEAARASPFMTDHPLLPGNFRIIFHDNDVCDFSLNECTMGLVAYEMQQLKRLLMARDAKDEWLTPGMMVHAIAFATWVPPAGKSKSDAIVDI